jgi:hypothetical protein
MNDELNWKIGNEETIALKPALVKIKDIISEEIGEKKNKKIVFHVKHPDNEELIKISSIKWENKGKLEVSGTWVNLDSKGELRKNSALVCFMVFNKVDNLQQFKDKEILTVTDEKGYLCFKAY